MAGGVSYFLVGFTKRELSRCKNVFLSQAIQCFAVMETEHALTEFLSNSNFYCTSNLGSQGEIHHDLAKWGRTFDIETQRRPVQSKEGVF